MSHNRPSSTRIATAVKRAGAERYLLLSLLSFAASVTLTRLFLELTGYPQLGNSELHIAHVLWGGLALFVAALLPLLFANRWVYTWTGLLSGVGVGLFIDEVGKFITQSNDYFYPAAAPIIYAFFLLVVLVYQRVRRVQEPDPRSALYHALDALQEVLDHDLDPDEYAALRGSLYVIRRDAETPSQRALAQALLDFLESEQLELAPRRDTIWQRAVDWVNAQMDRWLDERLLRSLVIAGLLLLGLGAVADLGILLLNRPPMEEIYAMVQGSGEPTSSNQVFLYVVRVILEGVAGSFMLAGGLFLFLRRESPGFLAGYLGLLLALTVVDLLVFYFDQFSSITVATFQFLLLLALLRYRNRCLRRGEVPFSVA
ncbi:MAG: hypothetical protein D6790_19335 [Caldilineae bacterium]|nr:MAG: hypothetical protein D6790_19335 [Caldilineae bacterium]